MNQPQATSTVPAQQQQPRAYPLHLSVIGFGAALISVGVLSIILQIVAIAIGINLAVTAAGIWSGIVLILAGTFGITAAITKTKCKVITFLVLSILGGVFACAFLTLSSIGLSQDENDKYWKSYGDAGVGLNATLVILSVIAGVLCILGAVTSCLVCCPCCRKKDEGVLPLIIPDAPQPVSSDLYQSDQIVTLRPVPYYPGHYTFVPGPSLDNCDQRPPTYNSAVHGEAGYVPNQAQDINQPAHHHPHEIEDSKS